VPAASFGAIERAAPGGITAAGLGDTATHGQIELLQLAASDHAGNRNQFCEEPHGDSTSRAFIVRTL